MKVLLINVCNLEYKCYRGAFSNFLTYAPLTLAYLSVLIPNDLYIELRTCDEIVEKLDVNKGQYDVVIMSFMSVSAKRAYELAQIYKKQGSWVVAGGYHPTFMPDEALEHFDTVIVGAAEISLPQFLYDFKNGCAQMLYDNQNVDLTNYKFPNRNIIPKGKYHHVPAVVANRGCTNGCEFCAISAVNKNAPLRPVKNVIDEIKRLKTKQLIFFDPNFFQAREYCLEIMEELSKMKIKWAANATIELTQDKKLLESASKSGCAGVLLGLESINEKSLQSARKTFNKPEKFKESIKILHDYKIFTHACFILGFDDDTEEDLLTLPDQIEYLGLDLARFAILTPVPNSELYKRLESESRIITKDWTLYDQNYAVFQPKNMTPQRLEEIYHKIWKEAFSVYKIFSRVKNSDRSFIEKLLLLSVNLGFKYVGADAQGVCKCSGG